MDTPQVNAPKGAKNPGHRGSRHLRVGLQFDGTEVRIASIWLVKKPAMQMGHLVGPIFMRVDIAGGLSLLQGFDDPRITRGAYRDKQVGHSYAATSYGTVQVQVPFDELGELADLRIRVLDATQVGSVAPDPRTVSQLFDTPPPAARELADLDISALRKHPDFVDVAGQLGWVVDTARFEIHGDSTCGFRWRLRRADGRVMAESAGALPSRNMCEEDIRWVRRHAELGEIVSHDLPGGACKN